MLRSIGVWLVFVVSMPIVLQAQYDPTAPEPQPPLRGKLFLHGGGPLDQPMREAFVKEAGGAQAKIVVIPTADVKDPLGAKKLEVWNGCGAAEVVRLHAQSRDEALRPEFSEVLDSATGVWFSGGKQTVLTDRYLDTPVAQRIHQLLQRGGVVGGTSAGTAIASNPMLVYSDIVPGFDFLPGVIVDQHFLKKQREPRLQAALAKEPGYLGIGIDERTALIVRGRKMEVIGESVAKLYLAPSKNRPARVETISPGDPFDLVAWRRAAVARAGAEFPPAHPDAPEVATGKLVIVGGGALPDSVWKAFIEAAGGASSKIVYVPCTEDEQIDEPKALLETIRRHGAGEVTWIHTKDRKRADDPAFYEPLKSATGVWFGGGRQWNLVDSYQHTETHRLFHEVLSRGGVIGGSSAGASIQGEYMPRGDPQGNRVMMAEGYERGLGFLRGVAIDQHFTQRQRLPDLEALKQTFPQLLGIGIDEGTAIVVSGSQAEVIGNGAAFFLDQQPASPDLTAHKRIPTGQTYDLRNRISSSAETK